VTIAIWEKGCDELLGIWRSKVFGTFYEGCGKSAEEENKNVDKPGRMQVGFPPGNGAMDALFLLRRLQVVYRYLEKLHICVVNVLSPTTNFYNYFPATPNAVLSHVEVACLGIAIVRLLQCAEIFICYSPHQHTVGTAQKRLLISFACGLSFVCKYVKAK